VINKNYLLAIIFLVLLLNTNCVSSSIKSFYEMPYIKKGTLKIDINGYKFFTKNKNNIKWEKIKNINAYI